MAQWTKVKRFWLFLVSLMAIVGGVAACLAIPGMPKVLHFDSTTPPYPKVPSSSSFRKPTDRQSQPDQLNATIISKKTPIERLSPAHKPWVEPPHAGSEPVSVMPAQQAAPTQIPTQHCETGSVCLEDNHGSVTVNNGDVPPPTREISEINFARTLRVLPRVGPNYKLDIYAKKNSTESTTFAFQLGRLLRSVGWQITPHSDQNPGYLNRERSGTSFDWLGKGFVCTGYSVKDEVAMATVHALSATGFSCQERPDPVEKEESGILTLLAGTRGDMQEQWVHD